MTRTELVARARTGDHDAFEQLVQEALPRLYGAAKLILRQPDRAEDAVQEALVLAWRHIGALREPGAWDAWLYRLTVRACHRLSSRQRHVEALELHEDQRDAGQPDFVRAIDERDRVGRQLSRLPVEQRTLIVLHFYLDLPIGDAADILGIPVGTAKSRLHRGLASMRIGMGHEPEAIGVSGAERAS